MPSARPARGTFWHWIHRRFAVTGRITAYGCHTCHQYVRGGRRAPDRPPARHIGRAQSISTRRQMTSLQGIQASSWSHVHVPPDGMLASVYLALFGIAYDTPPGDARCVPSRRRPRNVQSPTLVRGAFMASGLGRSDGSAHGSRMKGATRLQTDPCHAAGTGWLSWSTQRVPTPSHRGAVVHAERVHSDRAGRGMAGHERVANEREHSTAKSIPNPALWRTG